MRRMAVLVLLAALLSSTGAVGAGYEALIGAGVAVGLAGLTLGFFIASVARLKGESSTKRATEPA